MISESGLNAVMKMSTTGSTHASAASTTMISIGDHLRIAFARTLAGYFSRNTRNCTIEKTTITTNSSQLIAAP